MDTIDFVTTFITCLYDNSSMVLTPTARKFLVTIWAPSARNRSDFCRPLLTKISTISTIANSSRRETGGCKATRYQMGTTKAPQALPCPTHPRPQMPIIPAIVFTGLPGIASQSRRSRNPVQPKGARRTWWGCSATLPDEVK